MGRRVSARCRRDTSSGRLSRADTTRMRIAIVIPAMLLAAQPRALAVPQSNAQAPAARPVESQPSSPSPSQSSVRWSSGPVRRVEANAAAGPLRDELEIVDAGSEDVGPLGASLRKTATDPRMPTGFQRVYRVPGEDDKFMRGNGALFAVFPASVYQRTPRGFLPTTPAGTVYRIGMPGELHVAPRAASPRLLAPEQIDGRIALQVTPTAASGVERIDVRIDGRAPTLASAPLGRRTAESGTNPRPVTGALTEQHAQPGENPAMHASPSDPYAHLQFGTPRITRD